MDFLKAFVQKRRWLLFLWVAVDFFIIFLPQWLDAVWDLAEKIGGKPIAVPHPSLAWYWITIPVGVIMFGVAVWAARGKTAVEIQPQVVVNGENLTDTLTAMHRRLVELQKQKASRTKISYRQFEEVIPTLADEMGTVRLRDWPRFNKSVKARIQRAARRPIPSPTWNLRRRFLEWAKYRQKLQLAALSVASQLKSELLGSKDWTLEDGVKASEWLDGYNWGVKRLRDNDPLWKSLSASISHYAKDEALRTLIQKHIDVSYMYNNVSLIVRYSERFPKTSFSWMLHERLVGSPVSPVNMEIALNEVLVEIEKRIAGGDESGARSIAQRQRLASTIEVHECSLEPARPFYLTLAVVCTVRVRTVPVNIVSLRLYAGNRDIGEPVFPPLPITVNNSPDSYVLKYEVYTSLLGRENRSYISALAGGERFASQSLPIPYDSPLLPQLRSID